MSEIAAKTSIFAHLDAVGGAPINLVQLKRQTMGDSALAEEILGMFHSQCENCAKVLDGALGEKQVEQLAHQMKGCARSVGGEDLANVARLLENRPEDNKLCEELRVQCLDMCSFLNSLIKHAKP